MSAAERSEVIASSPLKGLYDTTIDSDSAYEKLKARAEAASEEVEAAEAEETRAREFKSARRYEAGSSSTSTRKSTRRSSRSDSIGETLVKSVIKTASTQSGRKFIRGVLGGLFKGR